MEYLQQRTPFIEKWERDMEEFLQSGRAGTGLVGDQWKLQPAVAPPGASPATAAAAAAATPLPMPLADTQLVSAGAWDTAGASKELQEDLFATPSMQLQHLLPAHEQVPRFAPGKGGMPPPVTSGAIAVAAAAAAAAQAAAAQLDKKRKTPDPLATSGGGGASSLAGDGTHDTVRKEMHNATEKRRREKINTKINELRELIPHCKSSMTNKADVLHHATEHIKNLHSSYNSLLEANRRLQEANSQLATELRELHKLLWRREQQQQQLQQQQLMALGGAPPGGVVVAGPMPGAMPGAIGGAMGGATTTTS